MHTNIFNVYNYDLIIIILTFLFIINEIGFKINLSVYCQIISQDIL